MFLHENSFLEIQKLLFLIKNKYFYITRNLATREAKFGDKGSNTRVTYGPSGGNLGHAQLGPTGASLDGPHLYQPTNNLHGLAQMGPI